MGTNGSTLVAFVLTLLLLLDSIHYVSAFASKLGSPLSFHVNANNMVPPTRSLTLATTVTTPTSTAAKTINYYLSPLVSRKRMKKTNTLLYQASYLESSNGRGLAILTLALSICVWVFSIPPEIRRQHICTTSACVADRSKCYDCVTFQEWTERIGDYYRNGGGVQFDLSIDPETIQFWANLKGE